MIEKILPEFQKYLFNGGFVAEKNIPYYAFWVSRFLQYSDQHYELSEQIRISSFLESLKQQKNMTEWKIRQAEAAVQLYLKNYLSGAINSINQLPDKISSQFWSSVIEKMRSCMRVVHYAYRTEQTYIDWVNKFYDYMLNVQKKDLGVQTLDSDDVRAYLSFLATKKMVSASTQNQAFNAILYLFRNILHIELKDLDKTVRAKRGVKMPVVFSPEEMQKLLDNLRGKDLLIAQLIYGSGLRLMELARLRVKDIDFDFNSINVRDSKGEKDRITVLSKSVRVNLHLHLENVKDMHEQDLREGYGEVYLPYALESKYTNAGKEWAWQYVFPASARSIDPMSGKIRRHHISEKTIQAMIKKALQKSGISKQGSVHTLRHSFATHLLMNGTNIREIQELLGHKHIETTMVYTHVLRNMSKAPISPLDNLHNLLPESNEEAQTKLTIIPISKTKIIGC
jgi:integron integrase